MTYLKRSDGGVQFVGSYDRNGLLALTPTQGDVVQAAQNIEYNGVVFPENALIMFNGNTWGLFTGTAGLVGNNDQIANSNITLPDLTRRVYADSTTGAVVVTLPVHRNAVMPDITIIAHKLVYAITVIPNPNDAVNHRYINGNPSYTFVTERDAITLTQAYPYGWDIV